MPATRQAKPAPRTTTSEPEKAATAKPAPAKTGTARTVALVEAAIDRVVTKRLRPLREDTKAVRVALDHQVQLRVEAELRAVQAEEQAAALRVRVAELESRLAAAEERPVGLFRWRRRVAVEG